MDSHRHLMLAPDSALRSDMATDLGMAILAEGGVPALTPKAISDRLGCSRQAVQQWFGGQEPLRHVVATAFCVRWGRWVRARVYSGGLAGLLPDTDEVVGWCRVWLALVNHAPCDARIADLVEGVRCHEREEIAAGLLAGRVAADPASDPVVLVHALVEGLRLGLCAVEPLLSPDRAVRLLEVVSPLAPACLSTSKLDSGPCPA